MNRRDFTRAFAGLATFTAFAGTAAAEDPRTLRADAPAGKAKPAAAAVDHSAHQGHAAADSAPAGRYAALATVYADCAARATECITHCQSVLATGDKSLGDCLKTALACQTTCTAVAQLARLNSDFAPALARDTVPVMKACLDTCRPHIEHHAICKACFDACESAIKAAQSI